MKAQLLVTTYYCPFCGKQTMVQDTRSDDYYTGLRTECSACGEVTDGLPLFKEPEAERKHWWDR